eukprot:TRINITY_DN65738_c0_g1_i1.p1 TRINITY_DN65738_c0_g1~~TRINITY_DN65738_c0_g1_i1.p1  ORF type:complete len:331 (+),score=31.83 TRINITY_DN65738_c0_g1_i1:76-993(+)
MADVSSVDNPEFRAYCDKCACELRSLGLWYHASGHLDLCKGHLDDLPEVAQRKYKLIRALSDLEDEQEKYVVKPVAKRFKTSAQEAKLAALVLYRQGCPTVAVHLVARCLVVSPSPDFFAAALQGEVWTVRRMLAWDTMLLHAKDREGELDLKGATALTHAVASGSAELVAFLMSARADASAVSDLGNTALLVAADTGQVDVVRILLESSPCSSPPLVLLRNNFGQTALHWGAVAINNALEVCSLLLDAKADPLSRCDEGFTAAHWANHPASGVRGACGRAGESECECVQRVLTSAEQRLLASHQ